MDNQSKFMDKKTLHFIEVANAKHNFKYDYSLTKFISSKKPVDII